MNSRPPVVPYQRPSAPLDPHPHHHHSNPPQHSGRVQKVLLQPIAILFRYLQDRTPVCLWLHDRNDMRLCGTIVGFDEFMNVVLEDAREVYPRHPEKLPKPLGRIMLKGDNICLVQKSQ